MDPIFKEAVLDISYISIFDKITAKFADEKNSLKVEKRQLPKVREYHLKMPKNYLLKILNPKQ